MCDVWGLGGVCDIHLFSLHVVRLCAVTLRSIVDLWHCCGGGFNFGWVLDVIMGLKVIE